MTRKIKASVISIIYVIFIAVLKVLVGLYINSIAILSEAFDSVSDLAISFVSYFFIKKAEAPADKDHPYGHGKFETLSAAIESIFILSVAVFIITKAIKNIIHGFTLGDLNWGILVMVISLISKILISAYLLKVSKAENSIALEGRAYNFRSDVYREAGVLIALILIKITGFKMIDPIVGIFVAIFVLMAFIRLIRNSMKELTDESISKEEEDIIRKTLDEHLGEFIEYHKMRTRKSGSICHLDLHLVLKPTVSIKKAHELCDHLEIDIKKQITDIEILIHTEPCRKKTKCDHICEKCV